MVGTEERRSDQGEGIEEEPCYYTPERIDRWLREWPLLQSLAETPRSSRHYLTHEHGTHKGPCTEDAHFEQRGNAYHGDDLDYADIQADIERAWIHLRGRWSIYFQVVEWRMRGKTLAEIAEGFCIRKEVACQAYACAKAEMARHLGWMGK